MNGRGLGVAVVALTAACGSPPAQPPRELRPVSLPAVSRVAESVAAQLRERYARVTSMTANASIADSERAAAYGEMGKLLMAGEFREAAEPALLDAQMLAPGEARWPYYLAHLYRLQGDPIRATVSFERALQLKPDDLPTLIWLGRTYLEQGRPDAAEPQFGQALSRDAGSVAALFGLGRVDLARSDYARAVEHLEQALALDSHASGVHYPLAMAYRGLGDLEKADAHLRLPHTGDVVPPDPLLQELGELLESAMAYQSRGIRALERGQATEAAAYFRKAIALEPRTPALRQRLGTALYLIGDARGAVEQLEEALRLSPEFARAHYSLGIILASSGRYQPAIQRFESAVTLEPDYLEARLALADTLRGTGRTAEALREYDIILKMNPGLPQARAGYQALTRRATGRAAEERRPN